MEVPVKMKPHRKDDPSASPASTRAANSKAARGTHAAHPTHPKSPIRPTGPTRGFLLLVVIGLLAVMLTLVIGFVSYTRGETNAVATIRDKVDGMMLMHSALDWTVANISGDLFDNKNQPRAGAAAGSDNDPKGIVSNTLNPGDPCFKWWYRPWEPGYTLNWWESGDILAPYKEPNFEAKWIDFPASYFPSGGIKGRFYVQVLDANAFINANNWLESCNPTQCQMSHMLMEAFGDTQLDNYYGWRDTGKWGGGAFNATPLRYDHAWRLATQTRRSTVWPNNTGLAVVTDSITPNWVTHNSMWTSLQGLDLHSLRTEVQAKGMLMLNQQVDQTLGPGNYYPPTQREGFKPGMYSWGWDYWNTIAGVAPAYFGDWNLSNNMRIGGLPWTVCLSLYANVDPDTGRSPVNVNTCLRSGEFVPNNTQFNKPQIYTMESVFNVESLRRIVKVGEFYYAPGKKASGDPRSTGATYIGNLAPADQPVAWLKHETLRMKMAYQYQETLCRYFTASYNHPSPGNGLNRKFPPFQGNPNLNYFSTYNYGDVQYSCQAYDYTKTRFPVGLNTFRNHCKSDLQVMSTNTKNKNFKDIFKGDGCLVDFDSTDLPSVAPGRLDRRTANAIYDNIVPGKALIYPSTYVSGSPAGLSNDYYDPLQELYDIQLGRDETLDDPFNTNTPSSNNVNGYYTDNKQLFDSGLTTATGIPFAIGSVPPKDRITLRCKGMDIAAATAPDGFYSKQYLDGGGGAKPIATVPWRQRCFGPDWFSTELTTTTTTFFVVITVQLQEIATNEEVFVSQWGAVVELSPDVICETANGYDSTYKSDITKPQWPVGDPNKKATTMGLGFYRGSPQTPNAPPCWPKLIKSAKKGDAYGPLYGMDAYPDGDFKACRSETASQGTQQVMTSTNNWADWRGTSNDPTLINDPVHAWNFYQDQNPADSTRSQTKKQIRIKAIWSLNSGTY